MLRAKRPFENTPKTPEILKIEYFYLSRSLSNTGSLRARWFIHV